MYIWIACDISRELAELRKKCIEFNRDLHLSLVAFSLPQHVSLKISFEVEDTTAGEVIEALESYLSAQKSFKIYSPVPEIFSNILWLSFSQNEQLERLHRELDELLLSRFGVPRHEYDKCFKFHSTLFIDDGEYLAKMHERVSSLTIPSELLVDNFIIGISDSGKAGEYRVLKKITLKK